MKSLFSQCIKRTKKRVEYKMMPTNEYELLFYNEEFEGASTGKKKVICYKSMSVKVAKKLFILKKFVEENNIDSEVELISILNKNPIRNRSYINLISLYNKNNSDQFLASLLNSIYDTAKKIEFLKLSPDVQNKLTKYNVLFSGGEGETI